MTGDLAYGRPVLKAASVALFRATMTMSSGVLWRPRLVGAEHFPRHGPCFVIGNHSNRWDPFIINRFMPWLYPTAGVMSREYFRSPFLATIFGAVGIVPASKRLAEPFLVRKVLRLIQDDRAVVIFPEGESRWDGTSMPWMSSTIKIFMHAGVPVHPLKMHGSYWSWPRWADYPRPARVVVEALPPVLLDKKMSVEHATGLLSTPSRFDELTDLEECRPRWAYKPASGIHRLLYRNPWDDSGPMTSSDGRTVASVSGNRTLEVKPDSSLIDATDGTEYTAADLYARIRQMDVRPGSDGKLLEETVDIHEEPSFPVLHALGHHKVQLFEDRVEVHKPAKRVVALDEIVYADVERNFKLQLYLRRSDIAMLQLSFVGAGSALQWKDFLERLRPDVVRLAATQHAQATPLSS